MKKWAAFLFICCLMGIHPFGTNNFSQTNVSPQFPELKGMEDQLGNTHLFYRIYSHTENFPIYSYTYNDIYHLDLNTSADSLFLRDYIESNPVMFNALSVNDYKFWNNNPSQFIYVGMIGGQDPVPFINRFDHEYNLLNSFCCEVKSVDISSSDDSLIYAGGQMSIDIQPANTIRSTDGGFDWTPVADTLMFLSLNTFNDNLLFAENSAGFLYRSTDGGNTFNLVDLLNQPASSTSFVYDLDQLHVYRLFSNQTLRVSSNNGEAFSWQTKYSSDSKIYISLDESISGTIYLADKKNIFISTDYGNNFSLYKTLERKIVGIYKKPNSNKLYAATKYKIYEITPDTVQVIKSLPIPEEVLNYYPLSIGNKWVYNEYQWGQLANRLIKEVVTDTILPNGKGYYVLSEYFYGGGGPVLSYERIDSINGKVYRYDEWPGIPDSEYVIDDLLAEVGDTAYSYRLSLPDDGFTIVIGETTFDKWGINKGKKVLKEYIWNEPVYSLVKDIGLDSIYHHDAYGEYYTTLKDCIIDGIVYGDTTTVGVEDEDPPIATNFKLEQNYPNPFNPSTVISYRLPVSSNVTLKVYDVLGNEIANLVNEEKPAGEYEVEFNAASHSGNVRNLTSGIYFYQLKAGSFIQTKKMILLK